MGSWIIKDHMLISDETNRGSFLESFSYKDIDEKFIDEIVLNDTIKTIQVSKALPFEAYRRIDRILERKPSLRFRLFNLYYYNQYDISFLLQIPHLRNLVIEGHLRDWNDVLNFNILTKLNLRSLYLNVFDLYDYSFVQHLSENLEELLIYADVMKSSVQFDCKWLLKYKNLQSLSLGKKAKKNITCVKELPSLKSFSVRGIKLTSFDFLKEMNLEKLALLWNSNSDLHELEELISLKEIELWRINKLDNIDFISKLTNLEILRLQDLSHIQTLPDLSHLHKLSRIFLDNTGININELDESIQNIVERINIK